MQPIEIFFSYSHKDEGLREQLAQHLKILERQAIISGWHDRKILPGDEWDHKINDHLETAQIILLLVSADFVASEYCYDIEVKRAMERHEAREAKVIPVILRPVDWTGTPFSKLQVLPKDGKPVTTWPNQDEAFVNVSQGIRAAVEELIKIRREKLHRYEIKFSDAVQKAYPISGDDLNDLQRLQRELELKEEDVIPIEERGATPIRESRQKALHYRQEAQHLVDKNGGEISLLSRSILDALQVKLGLSPSDANAIEEEILKPFNKKKNPLRVMRKRLPTLLNWKSKFQQPRAPA